MKVLVCGGRDYKDVDRVYMVLSKEHKRTPFTLLVHGGATGADSLAGQWAEEHGVPVKVYPADWERHGNAAGPLRNQKMLNAERPNMIIAFPGGRGTSDMISRGQATKTPVMQISARVQTLNMRPNVRAPRSGG